MPPERWRCFVAIPVEDPLRSRLASDVEEWRGRPDLGDLRWADPAGWHVTLAFLGAVDPAAVGRLTASLGAVARRHGAMRLEAGGLGSFPSDARARVAWSGVGSASTDLEALAADARRSVGVESTDSFRGHVTLARARRRPVDLRAWISEARPPDGALDVTRIELMRSHVGNGPARYENLASFELGVPAHV